MVKVKFQIKEISEQKGISGYMIAKNTGLAQSTVYDLLNNKNPQQFSGYALLKIAEELGVENVKDLFEDR